MSLFSNFPQSLDAGIKEEIAALKNRVQTVDKGGTGATTAEQALANLGGIATGAVGNLHVWERVQSGVTDYLTSTDRNAYTDGTVDNTTITYLGQLGGGARIEVGSYVGTGTEGSANPNRLTFGFVPKMVIVVKQGQYGFALDGTFSSYSLFWIPGITYFNPGGGGSSSYAEAQKNKITLSGKTLSWYRDSISVNGDSAHQLNESGKTYHYVAIG